jgi:hypothetical protein
VSRGTRRATNAPAAATAATAAVSTFVGPHVPQALQHTAASGAYSPYLAAAWVIRPRQTVCTAES